MVNYGHLTGLPDDKGAAVENVKARLIQHAVLDLTFSQGAYTISTDAHNKQTRFVLRQKRTDDTSTPKGYRTRSPNYAESP